jgi:hypothetical protein
MMAEAAIASQQEKLARFIHGKVFWKMRVHPELNALLGQSSAKQLKQGIFSHLARPRDLEPMIREFCASDST